MKLACRFYMTPRGSTGDDEMSFTERCRSGLTASLGRRMGGNATRVRISFSPPAIPSMYRQQLSRWMLMKKDAVAQASNEGWDL